MTQTQKDVLLRGSDNSEAEKWATKRLEYLNREIEDLDQKIMNTTGWYLEENIVNFKKARYKRITDKEELLENFPEYFL